MVGNSDRERRRSGSMAAQRRQRPGVRIRPGRDAKKRKVERRGQDGHVWPDQRSGLHREATERAVLVRMALGCARSSLVIAVDAECRGCAEGRFKLCGYPRHIRSTKRRRFRSLVLGNVKELDKQRQRHDQRRRGWAERPVATRLSAAFFPVRDSQVTFRRSLTHTGSPTPRAIQSTRGRHSSDPSAR
jgi:hypothetical protein